MKISLNLCFAALGLVIASTSFASVRDGAYVGTGVGGAFDRYDFTASNTVTSTSTNLQPTGKSAIGSLFGGYGFTNKDYYLGLELGTNFPRRTTDTTRQGVTVSGQYKDKLSVQDYVTADMLPGYHFSPQFLVYGRAGLSYSHLALNQDANSATNMPAFSNSTNKVGARLGLGANYAMTTNLSIAADYYYAAYPTMKSNWNTYNIQFTQKPRTNYVGLSLIYNFA